MLQTMKPYVADRDKLNRIPLKTPPGAKKDWVGIQHGDVIKCLELTLDRFKIRRHMEPRFATSSDKFDLVAGYPIEIPGVQTASDYDLWLGLITSNARRRSMELFVGTRMKKSGTSGPIVASVSVLKKHTGTVDLKFNMTEAITAFVQVAKMVPRHVRAYKDQLLPPATVSHAMTLMTLRGTARQRISWQTLGDAMRELRREKAETDGVTSWELAASLGLEVAKMHPFRQMDVMTGVTNVINEFTPNVYQEEN